MLTQTCDLIVAVTPETVTEFASDVAGAVPFAFPICWLGAPEIRACVAGMVELERAVLFLEAQDFTYDCCLEMGGVYCLAFAAQATPERIVATAVVTGRDGAAVLRMRSTLRVADPASAAAFLAERAIAPTRSPSAAFAVAGTHRVDADSVRAYVEAVRDENPLHRDLAATAAIGLDGVVIPGMLVFGLFEAALADFVRGGRIVRLSARFLAPLVAPAKILVWRRVIREAPARLLRLQAGTAQNPFSCVADAELSGDECNSRPAPS